MIEMIIMKMKIIIILILDRNNHNDVMSSHFTVAS